MKTMKKTQKSVLLLMLASLLPACSSVSSLTGSEPVGVMAGDRTISQRLRDSGIESNAALNLYKLDKRFKSHSRVNFSAFHDAVLITGQVPDSHLKRLASQNVAAIREVKAIHNELQLGEQIGYGQIMRDGVIKADIRKNLLLLPYLKDSRVKVVVENGVVYLMGILADDELQAVLKTVQQTPNIVKIVSLIDNVADLDKAHALKIKNAGKTPTVINQVTNHQNQTGRQIANATNQLNAQKQNVQNKASQKQTGTVQIQKLTKSPTIKVIKPTEYPILIDKNDQPPQGTSNNAVTAPKN